MLPRRASTDPGAGFVLVAVVLFVLALSFLLIYFYALSSYEAQFLERSSDGEQAFQSAVGGVDRVRSLLCAAGLAPRDVGTVSWSLDSNVVAAFAYQPPDSSRPMDWGSGQDVRIRVTADVRGERRTVEGLFAIGDAPGPYRQLFAVSDRVMLDTGPSYERNAKVALSGTVWQGLSGGRSWTDSLAAQPVLVTKPVIAPDLPGYFATHKPTADPIMISGGGIVHLNQGDLSAPVYYAAPGGASSFPAPLTVRVTGLAVWLFPNGVTFQGRLSVRGNNACLVIAAGDAGIDVVDGLASTIPVILVSSGTVFLRQHNDNYTMNSVGELAVYARGVGLEGPLSAILRLSHIPGAGLDSLYVGSLSAAGALPNGSRATHTLTLVPGTWHVSNR